MHAPLQVVEKIHSVQLYMQVNSLVGEREKKNEEIIH